MKKQIFLTGLLTLTLLAPVSEAQAQGYPTFDVAKLASLITNLIGRFQPVPQVLSRVNQVKSTIAQVQAVGQAAMSGDLKALGQAAAKGLQTDSFTGGRSKSPIETAGEGANGSTDAAKKIKDTLFFLDRTKQKTSEISQKISEARTKYEKDVSSEVLTKSLYMALHGQEQSIDRFKKADKAMKDAETIQDAVNANTMMIMAGNFERLNQIALDLAKLKQTTMQQVKSIPTVGFIKPKPIKNLKMGNSEFTEQEKDEADVDFE